MNNSRLSSIEYEKIIVGAAFTFFVTVSLYKLTNAPLWFDEVVEYWYSKILFGVIPFDGEYGATNTQNMYQRIITTFQPPLYNIIMYLWLLVHDSEWWFRFLGVIFGFISMIAIFKSVKKVSGSSLVASSVVFVSSCIFRLVYYWQECAEYSLVMATISWTMYYWIILISENTRKSVVCFTIASVFSVYSQYGAVFPVVVMGGYAFFCVLFKRNRRIVVDIVYSYSLACFGAGVPLYWCFLRKQLLVQPGGKLASLMTDPVRCITALNYSGGIVSDLFMNLFRVFNWSLLSYYSKESAMLCFCVLLILMVIVSVRGTKMARAIIFLFMSTYLLYYFCVKLQIYSYGRFGNRYNLFFMPIWIIMWAVLLREVYILLDSFKNNIKYLCVGMVGCLGLCFCAFAWTAKLQYNWSKQNNRGVVEEWYKQNAMKGATLVHWGADAGFAYYVRHNKHYSIQTEKNVIYMPWHVYQDRKKSSYKNYINGLYGTNWPNNLFIVGSHNIGDCKQLIKQFTDVGYTCNEVFNKGALLVNLNKKSR